MHILAHPHGPPVGAHDFKLEIRHHVLRAQRLEQRLALRGIDVKLRGHIGQRLHQMLRRVVAIHPRQRAIRGDEAALRRRLENALDRVVENRAILRLRLA